MKGQLSEPPASFFSSSTGSGCCTPVLLSGVSGNFSSANYPENYNNGVKSIWVITVEPDKVTASLHCRLLSHQSFIRSEVHQIQTSYDCVASIRGTCSLTELYIIQLDRLLVLCSDICQSVSLLVACCWKETGSATVSPKDIYMLQVIHLWFEDFSLGTDLFCTKDMVTLQDSLALIGKTLNLFQSAMAQKHLHAFGSKIPMNVHCRTSACYL